MPQTVKYDALATLVTGLKAGDVFTIGPDDVSPDLIKALGDISLTFTMLVTSAEVQANPPRATVVGNTDLFGIAGLHTTLTFAPLDDNALSGPFAMTVAAVPPQGTEWDLLVGLQIKDMTLGFTPNTEIGFYAADVGCDLVAGTTSPLILPITLDIPAYPGQDWTLTGSFDRHQPLTPDTFAALVGGFKLSDYLPKPLDALAKFGLTEIELAFAPAKPALSFAYLDIAYADAWSVLDVIHVPAGGVTLKFMVDMTPADQSYVELEAKFTIGDSPGVPVDIGAHFAPGDFSLWGRLQQGKSVSVTALFEHFKVVLPKAFPEIEITTLAVTADISDGSYGFEMVAQVDAGSELKINDLTARVAVSTQPKTTVSADFSGTIVLAPGATIFLEAQYDGGGGGLTLSGEAQELPIGDFLTHLGTEFGIAQIPEPIRSLELKTLTTSYDTASGDFHFKCLGGFTVHDTPVEVMFSIDLTHTSAGDKGKPGTVVGTKGYSATFGGSVTFAGLEFDVAFNTKSTGEKVFVADFQAKEAGEVRLCDLVAGVSADLASDIPEDISIGLKVLKFAFFQEGTQAGLDDAQDENGPAQPAPGAGIGIGTGTGTRHFLFGVELGGKIGLTDIPLIGDKLPEDATVEFSRLQFAYAKPGFDKDQAAAVNGLFPPGVGGIPAEGLAEGVLVSAELQLGDATDTLSLAIPTGQSGGAARPPLPALAPQAAPARGTSAGMSINVQKQFGPVGIKKLGLMYEDQRLFVTGDINLTAGVLDIGLLGLGIGSKISAFSPAVTLRGLTITVDDGPVKVSGGLYGTIDPLNFDGALSVTMPSMTIGALGGYAQLGDDPSFFMYLSVNRPLIGYPFFFLDGLAAGLGFNRDILIPNIDGVAKFPLVEWAMGQSPPSSDPSGDIGAQVNGVITALAQNIPPKVGQYWIAAGIKFSSFSVLNSFALLTVSFGTEFKIALMGLTTASLPPDTGAGVPPIGYVEMAMLVTFSPDNGILQVAAKLTPASYILTSSCRLTGGFAYYMWFKDDPSGDPASYHAGDFVVTLGGYNPAYAKPSYFPDEPLLGFNWQVDGNTTIKGGIYFALTPSAIMAGGRLEAVWQSGDLKAWFTAHADFLLSWKPFHYEASIGLSIGASYKLDLLFTSVTISVHIGVDLSLWGPSFGGSIYVDLCVISFTVGIGNQDKPVPQPIPWSQFKTSFLPKSPAHQAAFAALAGTQAGPVVIDTDSYCLSAVSAGLVKDLSTSKKASTDPDWIVSAEKLKLVTSTALPAKSATLVTAGNKASDLAVGRGDFGVGPVGIIIEDFTSHHTITVNKIVGGAVDPTFDFAEHIKIEPVLTNLPSGTWGGKLVVNPKISEVNATPANIAGLLVGYTISMAPKAPDHTPLPIDVAILQNESEGTVGFDWSAPQIPATDPFDQSTAMAQFQLTLTAAAGPRADIVAALNGVGLDLGLDAAIDIEALAAQADTTLLAAPVLSYLGEQRAA